MTSSFVLLINVETFSRLRVREGLSRKALGQSAGVSETVIHGIERGRNHASVTLDMLRHLADALGTTVSELTRTSYSKVAPAPDDAALEAALAALNRPIRAHDVALALGWSLQQTRVAAAALGERLTGTGQSLIHTEWDQLRLTPADVLTDEQRLRLVQSSPKARGLTRRTAAVLAALLNGEVNASWQQRASRNDRHALGALVNMGILDISGGRPILSRDFEYLREK